MTGPVGVIVIDVSNPRRARVVTGDKVSGVRPARTRHAFTSVAPFQLTCSVSRPSECSIDTVGGSTGDAVHGNRNARYELLPSGNAASKSTSPSSLNSVSRGWAP
jgi:hypothetical protein